LESLTIRLFNQIVWRLKVKLVKGDKHKKDLKKKMYEMDEYPRKLEREMKRLSRPRRVITYFVFISLAIFWCSILFIAFGNWPDNLWVQGIASLFCMIAYAKIVHIFEENVARVMEKDEGEKLNQWIKMQRKD